MNLYIDPQNCDMTSYKKKSILKSHNNILFGIAVG